MVPTDEEMTGLYLPHKIIFAKHSLYNVRKLFCSLAWNKF